jgi:hypothetical protein
MNKNPKTIMYIGFSILLGSMIIRPYNDILSEALYWFGLGFAVIGAGIQIRNKNNVK